MSFDTVNAEILSLEAEIARRCAVMGRLHAAGSHNTDEARQARAELDCLLLALRDTQRERDRLLIECGFPATLGWASRAIDCTLLRPLYTGGARPLSWTAVDAVEQHGSAI
jgi:hypothetical protein